MSSSKKPFWKSGKGISLISAIIGAIAIILVGLIPYIMGPSKGTHMDPPFNTIQKDPAPKIDSCLTARIILPIGTHDKRDAANYVVRNKIKIVWEPAACVMAVNYYQRDKMMKRYFNVRSGDKITIGKPYSGKTQIKIWREGQITEADHIWVWVQ